MLEESKNNSKSYIHKLIKIYSLTSLRFRCATLIIIFKYIFLFAFVAKHLSVTILETTYFPNNICPTRSYQLLTIRITRSNLTDVLSTANELLALHIHALIPS